jgi:dGTP triphosphohydrolase
MVGKNQVASLPDTPHIRDRMTHVLEVMAISGRMADHLGLNVFLAQAIAAGHDIGHVPFGHQGEAYLAERLQKKFTHEVMGVVIAQHLERRGIGLNCTFDTLDGMMRHSGKNVSETMTPEAWIVRFADKIAYLFADYNDFERLCWRCSKELDELMRWFGPNQRSRTTRVWAELYRESVSKGRVSFSESETAKNFEKLRTLMYAEYVRVVEQNVARILDPVYDFLDRSKLIPPWLGIALLTDREVCDLTERPHMLNSREIMRTGLGEIIETTDRDLLFNIDPTNPDLNW